MSLFWTPYSEGKRNTSKPKEIHKHIKIHSPSGGGQLSPSSYSALLLWAGFGENRWWMKHYSHKALGRSGKWCLGSSDPGRWRFTTTPHSSPKTHRNFHTGSDERLIQPNILSLTADRSRCISKEYKDRVCAQWFPFHPPQISSSFPTISSLGISWARCCIWTTAFNRQIETETPFYQEKDRGSSL